MELLLISEKKMKIMLDRDDMEAYGLNSENLDYNIAATRESLDRIFEIAKIKTGFQTNTGRMFVQAYPIISGGCEIFITVLEGGVSGLVGEGRGSSVFSCYGDINTCKAAVRYISGNPNVENVKGYKDLYTQKYYLLALMKKGITEESENILRSCFYESGALGCSVISRDDFSKERYEEITLL